MEKLANVPPEKTSKRDKSGLPSKRSWSDFLSIPATGTWAINLKIIKIMAVMKIFLRTSFYLKHFIKNWAIELNIFKLPCLQAW